MLEYGSINIFAMLSDIACNGCDLLLGDAGAVAHGAHVVRELRVDVRVGLLRGLAFGLRFHS